jgi:hypothetical protein
MTGIRAHLLREQAILLHSHTLGRFEDGLICGFGFQNDLLSFGARDLRTNQFGARDLDRFVLADSSESPYI